MVLALVEEETRRYGPTKNYLEYLPQPDYTAFETELMKNEYEWRVAGLPMDLLIMKRYELPQPRSAKSLDTSACLECVENSQAQLEHQATRIANLDLMNKHGANAWKVYMEVLSKMVDTQQKELQDLRKQIQQVNWERKQQQNQAGDELKQLEASWVGLVSKNYEIERAVSKLKRKS